jgi:hypothetical protein
MCEWAPERIILPMSPTDYIIDSALVLLVVIQMKERVLTNRTLIRPLIILAIAVVSYFKTFPTQGNDIPLILAVSGIGAILGVLSGVTVIMRRNPEGLVTARAGISSAAFWVLGMGSRFAFAVWVASASGTVHITHFSQAHHITSGQAFTVALLGMAVCEVLGRTLVMVTRRSQLQDINTRLVLA